MGQKTDMNRKKGRRLWSLLGAVWLVMACLAGCAASGNSRNDAGQNGTVQASEEIGGGKDQKGLSDANGEDEGGRLVETDGRESDTGPEEKTGSVPDIGSGEEPAEELREKSAAESKTGLTAQPEYSEYAGSLEDERTTDTIEESGIYTSKDEVALYIHIYGRLPDNYITKRKAEDLGWNSKEGNLWDVAPGMSIGGSRFGNYEGALPEKEGRKYFECDIDYEGGYRGAKRLIYSDDGLIFYTEDHYNTFEQLYGQ